ncbi:hypothetical protein [Peijinzhouia sedimentorum]
MNKFEEKVKRIFARYREAKGFHFTSDGQAFSDEGNARLHAKSLDNKELKYITRNMASKGDIQLDGVEDPEPTGTEGAANDFEAKGLKGTKLDAKDEANADAEAAQKAALIERHTELTGKAPAKNIGLEKLIEKVAELEAAAKADDKAQGEEGKTEPADKKEE